MTGNIGIKCGVSKKYMAHSLQPLQYFTVSDQHFLSRTWKALDEIWIQPTHLVLLYTNLQSLNQIISFIVLWTHTLLCCFTFFHYLDYYSFLLHSIFSSCTPITCQGLHQRPSPTQNFSWFTSYHYSIQSNFDICYEFTVSK